MEVGRKFNACPEFPLCTSGLTSIMRSPMELGLGLDCRTLSRAMEPAIRVSCENAGYCFIRTRRLEENKSSLVG